MQAYLPTKRKVPSLQSIKRWFGDEDENLPFLNDSISKPHQPSFYTNKQQKKVWRYVLSMWILVLLVGEFFIFRKNISQCEVLDQHNIYSDTLDPFLTSKFKQRQDYLQNDQENIYNKTRVVIIADPQLTDPYSYDYAPRGSFILPVIEFLSDIYMRKSYQLLQKTHEVDSIFFLGDLFDGAKILSKEEYNEELERWNWIFHTDNRTKQASEQSIKFKESNTLTGPWNGESSDNNNNNINNSSNKQLEKYTLYRNNVYRTPALFNVTGNHDVGYKVPELQPYLVQQFIKTFGPINYQVEVGGFNFVIISALTLQQLDTDRWALDDTWKFIEALSQDKSSKPRIVLSHVPWYRPPETNCGRYNGRGPLVEREGYSYTNMLSESLTQKLLKKLKPIHIFSGDDHDQCEYYHNGVVPEHTIGTFSWMQGVPVPSFAILTLYNAPNSPEKSFLQVELCFLPSQLRIYLSYALFLFISIGVFFAQAHHSLKAFAFASPTHRILKCGAIVARNIGGIILVIIPIWLFLMWIET